MGQSVVSQLHADVTVPLPLHAMVPIGTLELQGDLFTMYIGADERVTALLKEKSLDIHDTEIQDNTSDRVRFGEGSYETWYAKERTPYSLIHRDSGQLAAFVWFGPKPLGRKSLKYLSLEEREKEGAQKEGVWHTIVYRSYAPFRGKGLMGDFMRFVIKDYRERYPNAKLWAGLSASNAGSAALATKLGFVRREDLYDAEKNWVAMTLE